MRAQFGARASIPDQNLYSCLDFPVSTSRLVWPRKLHAELDVRTEFRAPVTFVVLNLKCESLTLQARHQQRYGTFARYMPRLIGVTAFLISKNNGRADLPARFINLEVDTREVIHFPFPGSGEGRFLRNSCRRPRDKRRRLVRNIATLASTAISNT
ncbi:MAG: hypothetical protein DMG49_22635 [Acidobacteria bacterium]|nr:MAG: hypothetical protein DMG49_22635 [Acidobacteriota bacterium]